MTASPPPAASADDGDGHGGDRTSGGGRLGVVALVLGVAAVLVVPTLPWPGAVLGGLALLVGLAGLVRARLRRVAESTGLAAAGAALGALAVLLGIAGLVLSGIVDDDGDPYGGGVPYGGVPDGDGPAVGWSTPVPR